MEELLFITVKLQQNSIIGFIHLHVYTLLTDTSMTRL